MSGRDLLRLQLELECKGFDESGLIVQTEGDEPDDISPVTLALVEGEYHLLVRADLPEPVRRLIRELAPAEAFGDPRELVSIVGSCLDSVTVKRMRSYVIRRVVESKPVDDVTLVGQSDIGRLEPFFEPSFAHYALRRPVFGVVLDGRVVSACTSSRENAVAAEAWVATEPKFRRRGLGARCTAAWAGSVVDAGKVAFYSHDEANVGSGGIACRLGAEPWLSAVVVKSGSPSDTPS